MTAELRRLHVTVPRGLLDKLAAARDALSHSHAGASDDEILELGLDLIIERHRKRRGIGATPRARAAKQKETSIDVPHRPTGRSRHVPADVWRGVWERDGGCCSWPLEDGGVCGATHQLELDHIDGWALGADSTIARYRILCRSHQLLHARQLYGDTVIDRYARGGRGGRCSEPVAAYGALRAPSRQRLPFGAPASASRRDATLALLPPHRAPVRDDGDRRAGVSRPEQRGVLLGALGVARAAHRRLEPLVGADDRRRAGGLAVHRDVPHRRRHAPPRRR